MKAIQLFRAKTGSDIAVAVDIEKAIPAEAGLGGGSSDAATTLWALNALAGDIATTQQLRGWAAEIGSDVAFFFSQGTALCTGRGEVLMPLPPLPPQTLWIVKPSEGLSTPKVYNTLDAATITACDADGMASGFYDGNPHYVNDLEVPAFKIMPQLAEIKDTLIAAGYDTVLMSGSGTSFFCVGDIEPPDIPGCSAYKASFLNRDEGDWYTR